MKIIPNGNKFVLNFSDDDRPTMWAYRTTHPKEGEVTFEPVEFDTEQEAFDCYIDWRKDNPRKP